MRPPTRFTVRSQCLPFSFFCLLVQDVHGNRLSRSEGLGVASFDMFKDGIFSSDAALPHRVNSHGLKQLQLSKLVKGFQIDDAENPMVGLEGRFKLLRRLAKALDSHPEFFGAECPRPGNLVDYVLKHKKESSVSIKVLWKAVIEGFEAVWPEHLSGIRRGDVWCFSPLKEIGVTASDMVPFHKLSQWLTVKEKKRTTAVRAAVDRMGMRRRDSGGWPIGGAD